MKILNFGSLNIDHVYQLDHFVKPGETIACSSYSRFCGGKGLNQSIALAHGGAEVFHGGRIGSDGLFLTEMLRDTGVDTRFVQTGETPTGHAIIQVNREGENSIVIAGGANQCIAPDEIDETIHFFSPGDYLLLQNEISGIARIMKEAKRQGMVIVFNPAPFSDRIHRLPLSEVDIFIINETEAKGLTGTASHPEAVQEMENRFPAASCIFTLGGKGALFVRGEEHHFVPASRVNTVDTTGAGDTFIGFFLAAYSQGKQVADGLSTASAAAALSVTRPGAAASIPTLEEVRAFRDTNK